MDVLEINDKGEYKVMKHYTEQDIANHYIVAGTDKQLNTPKVQKLLLKYGYVKELLEMVDIITCKEVVKDILSSKLLEDKTISIIKGRITSIQFTKFEIVPEYRISTIKFINAENQEELILKRKLLLHNRRNETIQKYIGTI